MEIKITVHDDWDLDSMADYVRGVAAQIAEGYVRGHDGPDLHWDSDFEERHRRMYGAAS
ncbi:hypothetical protein [Nocardioides massiliensis]|uniref:Uncharacterized protein n=1 Tax=Nocardioides massiliensis TaxID=1325935 RepID=A0ABT9NJ72_9ACTN|nr:hypothetical protein [Nocardioides massiliensis]MDP9820466.1 hypothetical protein [Nocardioides massiliensis]